MTYKYNKLKGRIAEKCGTQKKFAEMMGLSERTISLKMNNEIAFTQTDIAKASKILELEPNELHSYFFSL